MEDTELNFDRKTLGNVVLTTEMIHFKAWLNYIYYCIAKKVNSRIHNEDLVSYRHSKSPTSSS